MFNGDDYRLESKKVKLFHGCSWASSLLFGREIAVRLVVLRRASIKIVFAYSAYILILGNGIVAKS